MRCEQRRAHGDRPFLAWYLAAMRAASDRAGRRLLDVADVQAPAAVVELAEARERARAARDYVEADRLRDDIRAAGWEVRDGPDGPELLPAG